MTYKHLIELVKKSYPKKVAEELCSVQSMENINLKAMCDEDYEIDVTWMLMNGYKKVVEPLGRHGLLKTVKWVKK